MENVNTDLLNDIKSFFTRKINNKLYKFYEYDKSLLVKVTEISLNNFNMVSNVYYISQEFDDIENGNHFKKWLIFDFNKVNIKELSDVLTVDTNNNFIHIPKDFWDDNFNEQNKLADILILEMNGIYMQLHKKSLYNILFEKYILQINDLTNKLNKLKITKNVDNDIIISKLSDYSTNILINDTVLLPNTNKILYTELVNENISNSDSWILNTNTYAKKKYYVLIYKYGILNKLDIPDTYIVKLNFITSDMVYYVFNVEFTPDWCYYITFNIPSNILYLQLKFINWPYLLHDTSIKENYYLSYKL